MKKLLYAYQEWRLSIVPLFAICIDCEYKGITKRKFASLLSSQIIGEIFTGAGTCITCATAMSEEE
jgi:hypothetical protein